ncbi:cupin domain-containing protein [Rufibacter latericius]|nr:hypothetical protein [Rufibacter latericius]
METTDTLLAPMPGAEHREVGGVLMDFVRTGDSRVKRVVYPPGFKWSTHMKQIVGTDLCMHAHLGFLAKGHLQIIYADGITEDFVAPQVVAIEPGHDGWVVGDEPAVLIEFDFEKDTLSRLGMETFHHHRLLPKAE